MKIGILGGDNDFYYTFTNVLKIILIQYCKNPEHKLFRNKTKLAKIVNELSLGSYLLFQNKFEYSCSKKDLDHIKKYLRITPSDIFFDEYVDEYIKKNDGWCNSTFFVLDTDIKKIYSV